MLTPMEVLAAELEAVEQRQKPGDWRGLAKAARLNYEMSHFEQAIESAKRALECQKNAAPTTTTTTTRTDFHSPLWLLLMRSYARLWLQEELRKRSSRGVTRPSETHLRMAEVCSEAVCGSRELALDTTVLAEVAGIYYRRRLYQKAADVCAHLASVYPGSKIGKRALYWLTCCALAGGLLDEALALHSKLTVFDDSGHGLLPDPPCSCHLLVETVALRSSLGDFEMAAIAAEDLRVQVLKSKDKQLLLLKSRAGDPAWCGDSETWREFALMYEAAGSMAFAAALYGLAIKQSDDSSLQANRAFALEEIGDNKGAFAALESALGSRSLDELSPELASQYARVGARVLAADDDRLVLARGWFSSAMRACRVIQRRYRAKKERELFEAATVIARSYRGAVRSRKAKRWVGFALGVRESNLPGHADDDEDLLLMEEDEDDLSTSTVFSAAQLNEMDRRQAKRRKALEEHEKKSGPPLTSTQRRDRSLSVAVLRLQSTYRGENERRRMRLEEQATCGLKVKIDQRTVMAVIAARVGGAPMGVTRDSNLASLLSGAEVLVVRRHFGFQLADARRLCRLVPSTLRSLEVDCPLLSGDSLVALTSLLEGTTKLETLRLERCGGALVGMRGDRACSALGEALYNSTPLTRLEMRGSAIRGRLSKRGVHALLAPLGSSMLRTLRLSKLKLDDVAAATLAASLTQMSELRELSLESNHFTWRGARTLVTACCERQVRGAAMWRLGLERQDPPLQRQDLQRLAQELNEIGIALRLRLPANAWPSQSDLPGSFTVDADSGDALLLEDTVLFSKGDRVQVNWCQQRQEKTTSAWREATLMGLCEGPPRYLGDQKRNKRLLVRYDDGFEEQLAAYLVRAVAPPLEEEPAQKEEEKAISYVSAIDGKLKKMSYEEVGRRLRQAHPEFALLPDKKQAHPEFALLPDKKQQPKVQKKIQRRDSVKARRRGKTIDEEEFFVRRRDLETGTVEFLSRAFGERLREHSPELELLGLLPKKPLKRGISADQAGAIPIENMELLLLLPAPPTKAAGTATTDDDDAIRRQAHERCRSMQILVSL